MTLITVIVIFSFGLFFLVYLNRYIRVRKILLNDMEPDLEKRKGGITLIEADLEPEYVGVIPVALVLLSLLLLILMALYQGDFSHSRAILIILLLFIFIMLLPLFLSPGFRNWFKEE